MCWRLVVLLAEDVDRNGYTKNRGVYRLTVVLLAEDVDRNAFKALNKL